jgi:hypothetical protein
VRRGVLGFRLRDRRALIVWPTKHVAFRDRERRRWEQLFPDHRTILLEGAGHQTVHLPCWGTAAPAAAARARRSVHLALGYLTSRCSSR